MYNNNLDFNNRDIPMNSKNFNYGMANQDMLYNPSNQDERFFGGFLGPFLLGGITGGLVAPYFNNSNNGYYNQPPYYTNNYYYPPYYYGQYYY